MWFSLVNATQSHHSRGWVGGGGKSISRQGSLARNKEGCIVAHPHLGKWPLKPCTSFWAAVLSRGGFGMNGGPLSNIFSK